VNDKLFKIFSDRFVRMWREDKNDVFDVTCKVWKQYISKMDMRLTCITRDKTRVFVCDPMIKYSRAGEDRKPIIYISMDKDIALKILSLGFLP